MATVWSWNKRHYNVFGTDENTKLDIFHASTVGDLESVQKCIQNNIDVNIKDENGWTPLMFCSFNHQIEVMKLLINLKADVNLRNNKGETALLLVVKTRHKYFSPWAKMDQYDAVKLLLDTNADMDIKDYEGNSIIKYAKNNKIYKIIELINKKTNE